MHVYLLPRALIVMRLASDRTKVSPLMCYAA